MGQTNFDIVVANQFIGSVAGSSGSGDEQADVGAVFYVGNSTVLPDGGISASDGNAGTNQAPFSTLDYAIGRCTANRLDTIYLKPGHAENVTAAAGISVDVAGIEIVGIGSGSLRPTFTFTTSTSADINFDAANVTIKNVVFDATSLDAMIMPIDINAAGVKFIDCEFLFADSGAQAVGMATTGSANTKFINCVFKGSSDTGCAQAIEITGTPDGVEFVGCEIYGDFSNAGIYGTGAATNVKLVGNSIKNLQSGDHAVEFTGAVTGYADSNLFITDAIATAIDAGSLALSGRNYWQSTAGGDLIGVGTFAPIDNAANFIGSDNANNAVATTSVVSNADGSILERLEYVQATGTAVPSADVTTNTTSRDVVGNKTDAAIYVPGTQNSLAAYAKGAANLQERVAFKSAAVMTNGLTLFTVAGGPIEIIALASVCSTANGATASTLQYSVTPNVGSAQTISAASASLANAPAGASVTLAGTALATAALYNSNGPNLIANPGTIFCPDGTITAVVGVGSTTGTWAHYIRYKPLAVGVTVS